mgnify:CR=1 FL=1
MINIRQVLLVVFSSVLLIACGGGGGGGSTSDGSPGPVSSNSFSVALTDIDIRRVSNHESIDVEASGISSGTLTLNQ